MEPSISGRGSIYFYRNSFSIALVIWYGPMPLFEVMTGSSIALTDIPQN